MKGTTRKAASCPVSQQSCGWKFSRGLWAKAGGSGNASSCKALDISTNSTRPAASKGSRLRSAATPRA